MSYNVKELREKLEEKISGLGIDPKFKENPAYESVLSEIDSLISQMNMSEAAESVTARDEEGQISFDWTSKAGEKYSMSISSSSPDTFRCIRTDEKEPYIGASGQTIRVKEVIEEVATIDENGFITLTKNESRVNDIDCKVGTCKNHNSAERKRYTPNGIMSEREYRSFPEGELTEDFDRTRIDSMLLTSRQAFDSRFLYDKYETRTLLVRDQLDTAGMVHEDKSNGTKYSATVLLSQENGLRDMVLPGGYDPYPQEIVILPLSREQIETMIQRENNPKVKEGLREYAVNRENYYYNSTGDEHFVNEGPQVNEGSKSHSM